MSKRQKKKKEVDPEEQMRQKFIIKCRFRAIGRLAMANAYWLHEVTEAEEYAGVEDVKRRVAQAIRGKTKKKQLLTLHDKALLNKPAEDRTPQEKKYLYKIIGGLKCFKRYPNQVKRKLAAFTYFQYYGPNRVIVRQHHEAHAMYFIVTGDVVVSQLVYDDLLEEYVSVEVGTMHAGDMFGEVSLLHGIPRTATVTTVGHCELLQLLKKDFKNVLMATVQKQWDDVKQAMSAFTYFDALDEVVCREGCIMAKMRSYAINETILGDGIGVPNHVYFVLSGRCQMVENIQIITVSGLGKKEYFLVEPETIQEEEELDFDAKYFKMLGPVNSSLDDTSDSKQPDEPLKQKSILKAKMSKSSINTYDLKSTLTVKSVTQKEDSAFRKSSLHFEKSDSVMSPQEFGKERKSRCSFVKAESKEQIEKKSMIKREQKTYFMQVCIFNSGSCFGFGENMVNRRIVALEPVDCMLLPKIWLQQKNTCNIWTRIQHYLDKNIPTTKALFKSFVTERNWADYSNQLVEDVISRKHPVNWTSLHDVPYSIRIHEMLDI